MAAAAWWLVCIGMPLAIVWDESIGPHGCTWTLTNEGVAVTTAGHSVASLGRRRPLSFDYWLLAGGGHRIWFSDEECLRGFVDASLAHGPLGIADRMEAIFVGMHWAHSRAYPYDRELGGCQQLPEVAGVSVRDAREQLLGRREDSDESMQCKAVIVLATAEVVWRELHALPIDQRPFPILQ